MNSSSLHFPAAKVSRGPLKVALSYAVAGTLWILLSDRALLLLGLQDGETGFFYAALKGTLFVALSSLMIYALVARVVRVNKQLETILRNFFNETTDAIFVKDAEGRYLLANKVVTQIINRPVEEIIGHDASDFFSPELEQHVRIREGEILKTGKTDSREEAVPVKGGIRYFLSTKAPMRDDSGKNVGIVGIARDITERKLSEERLRTSEERLRLFLQHAAAPIAMFDREMRYLYVSNRWITDYNLKDRDITGLSHYEVFPEISEEWRSIHRQALQGETIKHEGEEFLRADGSKLWIRWEICPWYEPSGEIGGVMLFTEDISTRKNQEQALRTSEERYRRLVEMIPTPLFINTNNKISFCNPAFVTLIGATSEHEVLGLTPFDVIAEEYHALVKERVQRILKTGQQVGRAEMKFIRKDGRAVPVFTLATLIHDHLGNPAILVICIDQTELERASQLLQSIVQSVRDAIITFDNNGSIRSANEAATDLFGSTQEELTGRNIKTLLRETAAPGNHPLGQSSGRFIGLDSERDCVRRDGTPFPAELRISEFQSDGEPHFTAVFRDVTERKKLEEQFRQAQKMEAVGRLAGGVAHDFNNLLTVINGYSDMILTGLGKNDPQYRVIAAIRDAGNRAAALTAQLLAFSRKTIVELRLLDLNDVIRNSEKLIRRLIGEDIVVESHLEESLPCIKADLGQMDQLIINLAVNARDAMPDGGSLSIGTRSVNLNDASIIQTVQIPAGRYVELSVSDTGCGIPEDLKARIFEPFFTTKGEGKGTGLGLAVVYGVVKQAGGFVFVDSILGQGTTFRVLIPAAADRASDPAVESEMSAPTGSETILVVEDDASVRRLTRLSLEAQGYTVIEAASCIEAFSIIDKDDIKIHLLLTDVVMPMMNGRQLADEVRRNFPQIKIMFMSGYTDDTILRQGVSDAADAFIQKPFTPRTIAIKVRAVLDLQ